MLNKPSHPLLDARSDSMQQSPMWVKLPSLLMEFWSVQAIIVNGDLLRKIILVDDCLMSDHRSMARVLIDLDVHGGLYESLDLVIGDNVYSHLLDYQHMPFRCTRCHVYG